MAVAVVLLFATLGSAAPQPQPAKAQQTFPFQGVERQFVLHRPANRSGPLPVVVALHGLGETVPELRRSWTMDAVADREGFAVLYPVSLSDHWSYVDIRAVPLPNGTGMVDDVGFITGLLDRLTRDGVLDPAHVYVAGVSNGGLMAFTLACQAPARFAAIAAIITGMLEEQAAVCHPSRLVPLLAMAGTDDMSQDYDGAMGPNYRLMSVPETLEFWRKQRGCGQGLDFTVAPQQRDDPTHAVLVAWKNCRDPSPLRFWRIEGGNHSLPSLAPLSERERQRLDGPYGVRSREIEAAEELWVFFKASGL
jgi:polyhydroxybutyrate depolymerase